MKKLLIIILRRFTNIHSISFNIIRNYYQEDDSQKIFDNNLQKIVSLYQINNNLLGNPPIKAFYYSKFNPEKNISYLLFEHKDKKTLDNNKT